MASVLFTDESAHLAQADRHISGAKQRIVRQRQLIARLAATGHDVRNAESFLSILWDVLSTYEHHRLLILDRLRS
jgi:hypothetical protein